MGVAWLSLLISALQVHTSTFAQAPPPMAATCLAPISVSGGSGLNRLSIERKGLLSAKSAPIGKPVRLIIERKSRLTTVRAAHNDEGGNGGSGFLAGFLLGGAIVGTLIYTWAPQIRRTLRSENEHGFVQGRRPLYYYEYDQPKVKAQQALLEKKQQLNDAIKDVSLRLRGKKRIPRNRNPDQEILGI